VEKAVENISILHSLMSTLRPHISELDISLQKPYNNSVEVQK
jgi:GH35 family endo-1,4-beta-xylanase